MRFKRCWSPSVRIYGHWMQDSPQPNPESWGSGRVIPSIWFHGVIPVRIFFSQKTAFIIFLPSCLFKYVSRWQNKTKQNQTKKPTMFHIWSKKQHLKFGKILMSRLVLFFPCSCYLRSHSRFHCQVFLMLDGPVHVISFVEK